MPITGSINVCGHEIDCAKENLEKPGKELQGNIIQIRKKLGMVFQSFNLWSHMTILENIIEAPVHVLGKNREKMQKMKL